VAFKDKFTTPQSVGGTLYFITGQPGVGKTTLIGSLANLEGNKLLILDAGGGMRALSDREDITVATVDKFGVMKEAYEYLKKADEFNWVAADLVTEVYNRCLEEVVAEGSATKAGRATLEARGIANDRFVAMVRDYRILAETKGINVIFTSHTQETKDDDSGMVLVRANLTPGTLSSVLGIVDVATYLQFKKGKRELLLVGNERVWAKTRKPLSYGMVPEKIEDPTFEKILEALEPTKV
jgi:phage nucleotide-binding protein